MQTTSLLPVLGLLALAVAIVILLLRYMRSRHAGTGRRQDTPNAGAVPPPAHAPLTKEEEEYLDSSHISGPVAPGGDALETWRKNTRK